jgi:hypothetical protein
VRFHPILRIREHVRTLVRKVRKTAVVVFVLAVLAVILVVGKNTVLNEVRKGIRKTYAYDRLTIAYFPPALVIENLRSLTDPPAIRVRRVRIEVPYLSLLRNRKSLSVLLDAPEIRVARPAAPVPRTKPRRPLSLLSLPFIIERGLIENGSVFFESGTTTVEARGVRAIVTQDGEAFTVRATAATSGTISSGKTPLSLGGLTVLLSGRGEDIAIESLAVEGPGLTVNASGRLRDLSDPTVELDARFDADTDALDSILHMPFGWKGRASGAGRLERKDSRITFTTSVGSDDLVLSGVPMGRLRGRFELLPGTGGRLEAGMVKPGRPAESLILTFRGGRVEGRAAPIVVDPVFRDLGIPWPVRSLAAGTFSLENRRLAVDAEFLDDSLDRQGDLFAFRGGVKVGVDFAASHVTIDTPGLESSFGRFDAHAAIDLKQDMDVRIRGEISDVKGTREFVSLVLDEEFAFGEIRGRGYADVRLSGRSASPSVAIKATLSPGGFDRFDAAAVEADALISPAGFDGRFDVDDPALKGLVRIKTRADTVEVDVESGQGELASILPALDIPVALSGRAAGDFRMVDTAGAQEFSGTFTSPEIQGYGETAKNVSGRIEWKAGRIAFPELAMDFHGGRIDGRLAVGTVGGEYDVDLRGEELDFRSVVPSAAGSLSLSLAGRGVFGRDKLAGLFSIKDMVLSPLRKTEARGDLRLDVAGGKVLLDLTGGLVPGENPFEGAFMFPLSGEPFMGTLKGSVTSLDLILPWDGAKGRLSYVADLKGEEPETRVSVAVEASIPLLPLPDFAYAVTDFRLTGRYLDSVLTVTSIGGALGGGAVTGSGEAGFGAGGIATLDLKLEGRDMVLAPMERVRTQADASLRLIKDRRRFVTEGEILFKRLDWRREIYEEFGFSSQSEPGTAGPSFFDGMSLNIRLRAEENALIENTLGRFSVRFNLTATGAFAGPVLLGDIDLVSGDFYFQDRSFRVIHGRLSFTDPVRTEPFLDFRGETYVKDYRVTLDLRGPTSRLKPEFSSSPPLPPEEILSLLALGESFRRTYYSYSGDRSTALNTASLLTYQIADLAKKRTGGLFSLDRLRIDPYIPEGATGGIAARITVGKKVSKNLLFLYSTILANSTVLAEIEEVPIFRMEWDISRRFSLVGGRDDRGRLGIDVKFRKRF